MKNKGNKTFTSRLSRWDDRLLPFEFELKKWSGKLTGITDYLINYPVEVEGQAIKAESLWSNWFTINNVKEKEQSANERKPGRTGQPIKIKKESYSQNKEAIKPAVTALMMSVNKIDGLSNEKMMLEETNCTCRVDANVKTLRKNRNKLPTLSKPFHPIATQKPVRALQNFTLRKENFAYEANFTSKQIEKHGQEERQGVQKLTKSHFRI